MHNHDHNHTRMRTCHVHAHVGATRQTRILRAAHIRIRRRLAVEVFLSGDALLGHSAIEQPLLKLSNKLTVAHEVEVSGRAHLGME